MPKDYGRTVAQLQQDMKGVDAEIVKVRRRLTELENERDGLARAVAALEGIKRGSLPVTGMTSGPTAMRPALELNITPKRAVWGSLLDFAEGVLRDAKIPLHATELVKRIQARGRDQDRPLAVVRASLVSSLDRHVAQGKTFTKPEPGTYGLREWGTETKTA